MHPRFLRPLVLGLALVAGAPAAPAATAAYDFYIRGLRVGALTLGSEQQGANYVASGRIDPTGLIALFADYFFDGTATGQVTRDGQIVPARYVAVSKSPRRLRHTEIEWQNGRPVRVSVEPPRSSAPDPAQQVGALDPVSAGFKLFRDAPPGEICNTSVDVFDGSRRSRLRLGVAVDVGGSLTCQGVFTRVEGEAHSAGQLDEFGFTVVFRRNGQGVAQLQSIEAPTRYGRAVISRRR